MGHTGPVALSPADRPLTVGAASRFQPAPSGAAALLAAPIPGIGVTLGCQAATTARYGVHLELFVDAHVVVVPAGIGFAPPLRRDGATVLSGRCSYPVRTLEPTGVVQVSTRLPAPSLGDLFAVWGQPLTARRLAGFWARRGDHVRGFVDGHRWAGPIDRLPLGRHAAITVELGPRVLPHPRYLFPPGL